MIRIMFGFEIKQQRRVSMGPQCGCAKEGASQEMRSLLRKHPPRRPGRIRKVIRGIVEKFLDAVRIFHAAQLAQLGRREAVDGIAHRRMSLHESLRVRTSRKVRPFHSTNKSAYE